MAAGPPEPSAAHAFVADLDAPVLDDGDRHHLERVLRLRPGQPVTVADGAGGWRPCTWRGGGVLEPAGEVVRSSPPEPPVAVGFALTKGDRPEWVVQKLTELGVDRIVAFVGARSVVRWDAAARARHVGRWRRVAREAAMQSRRAWLPAVDEVTTFPGALAALGPSVALAERGGPPPGLTTPAVMVGPEGGWEEAELEAAERTVGLGPTVLRAETAAVAAAVVLCGLRSGIIRHIGREMP